MTFLQTICYFIIFIFLIGISPAFSAERCRFTFLKVFGKNTEGSNLIWKDRVRRTLETVFFVPHSPSLATRRLIKEKGWAKALVEIPESERVLIDFSEFGYLSSDYTGVGKDTILKLLRDKQLDYLPVKVFEDGNILDMQATASRLNKPVFKMLLSKSSSEELGKLTYSFIKDNALRLSQYIVWFPQIKEFTEAELRDLNLEEKQVLAYIEKHGLSDKMRKIIPEGSQRERAENVHETFLKRKEQTKKWLGEGTDSFKELIQKEKDIHAARKIRFEMHPLEKVRRLKDLRLEEMKLLSDEIKEALVSRAESSDPPLVFLIGDFDKISYLLPFASMDNIIMVGPIFRKNILKNLKPEDKERLSKEQLANLMEGIKEK